MESTTLLRAQPIKKPPKQDTNAITARDLKIGNYVKQGVIQSIAVSSVYCSVGRGNMTPFSATFDSYYVFDDIDPLPITSDILTMFGFSHNGMGWHSPNKNLYIFGGNLTHVLILGKCEMVIDSVHHLQNVYYDLFGDWLS